MHHRLFSVQGSLGEVCLHAVNHEKLVPNARVAELGSLSSGAKMAMKIFAKHVFTISTSNASFLRVKFAKLTQ